MDLGDLVRPQPSQRREHDHHPRAPVHPHGYGDE
jgi:hypothetical protein